MEESIKVVFISGITEAELLSGKECKPKSKRNSVSEFISLFEKNKPR